MDWVTVILIVVNLLVWPALGLLALKQGRKKDLELLHLEQKLREFEHVRAVQEAA